MSFGSSDYTVAANESTTKGMKAIVTRRPGQGIEAWELTERAEPTPGPGEVLVRVRATSLNYRDLMIAKGLYLGAEQDLVPLSDGAGEILGVGAGVARWKVGDRVAGAYHPHWLAGPVSPEYRGNIGAMASNGWLAEQIVFPAEGLVRIPMHLSFEEAATLPCAAVTAWGVLFDGARPLKPGQTVLVQGTGGVSIFAAQLALATGSRVIATTSTAAKAARLRELGVEEVIDYRTTPAWGAEALRRTGGVGVDKVVEVGGAGTFQQSIEAVRLGGSIHVVGFVAGMDFAVNPMPILYKSLAVEGISVGSRQAFEDMNRLIDRARLRPVIDEVFPLERASAALAKLASGAHFGKIVVAVG